MADLPPLGYGLVRARYVAGIGDGDDEGRTPDVVPLTGTVTFTLSATVIRVVTAQPVPTTVYPTPIVATLDGEGYLTYRDARSVPLLATDDPAMSPTDLQWTASFDLRSPTGHSISGTPQRFTLPRGATVDLTEVAPLVTAAANTVITQGARGEPGKDGKDGVDGAPGPNTVPTNEAIAQAVTVEGPARRAIVGEIVSMRLARGAASTAIHGWHTGPQHIYVDGVNYIGGIEGEPDANGDSAVVVDVIDHRRNLATRVPVFLMPVDDHSPAAVSGNSRCPVAAFGVPHQKIRGVVARALTIDSFGIVSRGAEQTLPVPAPSDTGATSTYVKVEPVNPRTAFADGYSDFYAITRVAWHYFGGTVRLDHATLTFSMATPWRDVMTFRDPGLAADGDVLQGYIDLAPRGATEGLFDFIAFGHPRLAADRDIYVTSFNLKTGDVGGGIANLYTGAGLPINRRQMEVAYKRQPNTNLRCLGVGGLSKRQALIAKWDTSGGTTAATPPNNRYKLLTRGAEPAVPGLVLTSTGHAASADRAAFDVVNLGIEVLIVPTSTRPASALDIASKWASDGNQRSWRVLVNASGSVALWVSADGSAAVTLTSTAALPTAGVKGIGVGYVASTGVATFYLTTDGRTWQQLGATVSAAPTAAFNSTTSLQVGRAPAGQGVTLPGVYQRLTLRDGWGGTLAADADFTRGWANAEGAGTSRTDTLGNIWVVQAGGTISAVSWAETADLGPTGDPVGYDADTQYIAGGMLVPRRDDTALISRRLPGGLARTVVVRAQDSGAYSEEVLAESLSDMLFRATPVVGEGSPLVGDASAVSAYGPDYTQYRSRPVLLWQRGPLTMQ